LTLWMVRAGARGEREDFALQNNVVVIGWEELPDLSDVTSRDELDALCREIYPELKPNTVTNWVGQLWAFRERISVGDLVVLPLKTQSAIAIGEVVGPYAYNPEFPPDATHHRRVKWLRTDLPRSALDQDLLYSLGAFLTVCQIQRNNAEQRIRAVLRGERLVPLNKTTGDGNEDPPVDEEALLDIPQYAKDQIRTYIGQKFKGHELSRLVTALLKAQGYQTQMAPPGADGGVDIIAGQGPLGFDPPRLCVQVKSSDAVTDVKPIRELRGVLQHFGADQGLFVGWGGFTQPAQREARQFFFQVRLWDAGDLVDMVLRHYDALPDDLRAELPLQRIWTLVLDE